MRNNLKAPDVAERVLAPRIRAIEVLPGRSAHKAILVPKLPVRAKIAVGRKAPGPGRIQKGFLLLKLVRSRRKRGAAALARLDAVETAHVRFKG